jgi:hypothetical protein
MAGGIYKNRPLQVNAKCVIFSIIIIALYFYCPKETNIYWKTFTAFVLFVISYVSLAWYDYKFDCQTLPLKRGEHSITGYLKPPTHMESQTDESKLPETDVKLKRYLIHIIHIFLITPLLLYIGVNKDNTNSTAYVLLISIFIFSFLYHGSRLVDGMNPISVGHIAMAIIGIYYSLQDTKSSIFYNTMLGLSAYIGIKHTLLLFTLVHGK